MMLAVKLRCSGQSYLRCPIWPPVQQLETGSIGNKRQNRLTVLASLVLIVTEGTVESSQLTKLITLEFVLAFGNGSGLEISR
jgi:hypothetical protein